MSRENAVAAPVSILLMLLLATVVPESHGKCAFEAIFNFGDSNSDTGGFAAAFPSIPPPHGMTFFGTPAGRYTDGRLPIDFLAQALGLPFVCPYLQSIGSNFKHGANFATSASPVLQPDMSVFASTVSPSPFYLRVQINQMKEFKNKVECKPRASNLPNPKIFGRALYTINIGHNDVVHKFASDGPGGVKQIEPQLTSEIANAVKELYSIGGRTFFVQNLNPMGCYAASLALINHDPSDVDKAGCMVSLNNAVQEFNSALKDTLEQTRQELKDANIIYVDTHSVLLELYQNPTSHGFKHGITACCGYGGGPTNFHPDVFCGDSKEIDGKTVSATACGDPEKYVSWDGIHFSEAANKIVADTVVAGTNFDPPFNLNQYCEIQPIG
ncbi:GDSL esterase/lipase At4g01130-like [Andrographis paniculata]|uniref:GDSL esterase/lipase At4g01130-like n=1 Tax=Andrographis paniculata TaxID=175694 RepID=UPI0021E82434|nr:GDSL esterase/lipase At4g01130-like [Andrographis paniculata]